MFYVIAIEGGLEGREPTIDKIFSSEEKALEWVKNFSYNKFSGDPEKITHQYDINEDIMLGSMCDPLWLGKVEEGGDIIFYRALTNDRHLSFIEQENRPTDYRPL